LHGTFQPGRPAPGQRSVDRKPPIDFLDIARPGAWLEIISDVVKAGRSLCFVECKITADGQLCARGTATFKVVA
jgi:acyl-coenzyme A thioesterase PaaI-like protein